jgi:hypothetical protein
VTTGRLLGCSFDSHLLSKPYTPYTRDPGGSKDPKNAECLDEGVELLCFEVINDLAAQTCRSQVRGLYPVDTELP